MAVDHIVDCGSLTSWEDIQGFMQRLFCTKEGLQILCHDCHDIKTHMEKTGLSKEEAKRDKQIISLLKPANKRIMQALLDEHGYVCKNPEQRRKALDEIFAKKGCDE